MLFSEMVFNFSFLHPQFIGLMMSPSHPQQIVKHTEKLIQKPPWPLPPDHNNEMWGRTSDGATRRPESHSSEFFPLPDAPPNNCQLLFDGVICRKQRSLYKIPLYLLVGLWLLVKAFRSKSSYLVSRVITLC